MNKEDIVIGTSTAIILFIIVIIVLEPNVDLFNLEISRDISLKKTVNVDRDSIFEIMASPELYPKILTKNILDVNIINQTENVIFAEETITERGFESTILVRHEIFHPEKQIIEILDGDVKGSKIEIQYSEIDSKTVISSKIHLTISGPFGFFSRFMGQSNFESAYNTIINAFVEYLK